MTRGSPSNPAATCCKQAIVGEQADDDAKQMSRRSSRDGAGAKQPTDYAGIAEAGGLATSSKIPLIDVELDCMTAALARVFKAPGAAGDSSGANLFSAQDPAVGACALAVANGARPSPALPHGGQGASRVDCGGRVCCSGAAELGGERPL